MNLLLDTHVWIWSQESPERLGPRATRALLAAANQSTVCTISTLEIARLIAVRAIELRVPLSSWIERSLGELAAQSLPVTHEIAADAYALPAPFHRDPVDRVLVAAARRHQLALMTADDRILRYDEVRTLDARR
ncbi:MAG: type II toxin-antitoxin system VapC family toxin [Myxococcota bacterium]